jgi:hypothetical protein
MLAFFLLFRMIFHTFWAFAPCFYRPQGQLSGGTDAAAPNLLTFPIYPPLAKAVFPAIPYGRLFAPLRQKPVDSFRGTGFFRFAKQPDFVFKRQKRKIITLFHSFSLCYDG